MQTHANTRTRLPTLNTSTSGLGSSGFTQAFGGNGSQHPRAFFTGCGREEVGAVCFFFYLGHTRCPAFLWRRVPVLQVREVVERPGELER